MASVLRIGAPPGTGLTRRTPGAARFGLQPGTGQMLKYLTGLFKPALNQPGLAPLSPGQISRRATGYVTSAIKPQIGALEANNARAVAGGVGSIRGGTANYAAAMAPYADRAAAIGREQAASDTAETGALSAFLRGSGAETFGDVAAKLKAAGIDAPAAPNLGEGSAGITGAVGIANARAAGATGATNAEYANLLPGFASLAGQQAENQFRSAQQGSLADAEASLRGQIPGLTSQVVNDLTSNETTKAGARANAAGDRAGALATFLGNAVDDKTQLDLANLSGLFGVQKAGADAAQPDSGLTGKYGIVVDHNGKPVLDAGGKVQPAAGYHIDPKTGRPTKDISPTSKNTDLRVREQAHRTALAKADSTARTILGGALKAAAKKSSATAGPFGGSTTAGKPTVGGASYNEAVNAAVTSLETILGPYMTHEQIVQFVQQRAMHSGWAQPTRRPQPLGPVVQTGPDGIIRPTSPFNPAG